MPKAALSVFMSCTRLSTNSNVNLSTAISEAKTNVTKGYVTICGHVMSLTVKNVLILN